MFLRVYLNNCVQLLYILYLPSHQLNGYSYSLFFFLLQATLIKKKLLGNILCQRLFPEHSFQDLEFLI